MEQDSIKPVVIYNTPEVCDTCTSGVGSLSAITQVERRGSMQRESVIGYFCSECETTHIYK